ncbi:MAG: hypothetical protein KAT56_00470 [Sedimentisphaerales bacterium]|nr:hypothetical protein [Sedimentisphaerales bacterium]
MKKTITISIAAMVLLGMANGLPADSLSIYDIQYTTNADGTSLHVNEVVDCFGGIVIHKYAGYSPKLTLYDPAHPDGWGGLTVKDFTGTDAFSGVNVGEWLSFTNTIVEESRGNTQLAYESGSGFVVGDSYPTPDAISVTCADIAAPVEGPADEWHVIDHSAEMYEAMYLRVEKITVTRIGLGKASDNYVLQSFEYPSDPNWSCWAADYMNVDAIGDYHPYVELGSRFCAVEGILEQYTNPDKGWDYYQLLTTTTDDFTVGQTADFDDDCDVDLLDFGLFAAHWLEGGCKDPNWCGGADLNQNTYVDPPDLEKFSENWLVNDK